MVKNGTLAGLLIAGVLILSGPLSSCASSSTTVTSPTTSSSTVTTTTTATSHPLTATPTSASDDLSFLVTNNPALVDNSFLPVTPVDKLHLTGTPLDVDIDAYRLVIDGLVDNPFNLTYDEIKALPSVTEVVLLICPGVFVDKAEWTGVPVAALLGKAGLQQNASLIIFHDGDRYQQTFFIKEVVRDGVFLAYNVDGQPLPNEHGFPLRLVVKGEYGNTWVKWIDRIEIK
jgi:DMSO/TMAO reductase YedYZ molybdopterin-dependent catalytic subunit